MFANRLAHGTRRRGIVLVLILGMLGLLALIGVTFATYAGQALVNARNSNLAESRPTAEQYMDFALAQLINDTNNPLSAIRGHSLLRDMYGNDSTFRGTTAADYGGLLQNVTLTNGVTTILQFPNDRNPIVRAYPTTGFLTSGLVGRGFLQFRTNIPTAHVSYQYFGLNFTRWILKIQNVYNNNNVLTNLSQTFEVLEDDDRGQDPFSQGAHLLTLGPIDGATHLYNNPNAPGYPGESGNQADKVNISLTQPAPGLSFVLDGRFMNAFNGPGLSRALIPVALSVPGPNGNAPFPPLVPFNVAAYANFKVNSALITPSTTTDPTTNFPTASSVYTNTNATGFGNPDLIGMDEDYDACDLENWFLALQSADGQVMIPSFHRPSILTAADWTSKLDGATLYERMNAVAGIAKILRPRQIDNAPQFPADPSTPDATGRISYDVDNDGDGQKDSVWLDLGYPVQKNNNGKLFKPLFAFMVIGQNGRLPLNTVGNLQDRDSQYGKIYQDSGMLYSQYATANTYYDAPTWDHTSHVGYSVNEINPKFALQNAPANIYDSTVNFLANTSVPGTITGYNPNNGLSITVPNPNTKLFSYSQVDNSGVDVALTQLRNILAGTVPMDNLTNPNTNLFPSEEGNFVAVNGSPWWMPNSLIDGNDPTYSTGVVSRSAASAVAGRWGEPEGIPKRLSLTGTLFNQLNSTFAPIAPYTVPVYLNPVRAGRSYYSASPTNVSTSFLASLDLMDDDLDSAAPPFGAANSELNAVYDPAGQVAIPAERASRFLTPTDPSGNGQLMPYMTRPTDVYDHGSGSDAFGRISFFRYFRPPGLPQIVDYTTISSALSATSPYHIDIYKMPTFAPVGNSLIVPNTTNNQYHSYESFRAPAPKAFPYSSNELASLATMAPMPFNNISNLTTDANGNYLLWPVVSQTAPTIAPATYLGYSVTSVGSESGPYLLGNGQNPTASSIAPNTGSTGGPGTLDNNANAGVALAVHGYPLGSLNKDEADEMNLYNPNRYDQQFGPSDLEWLYRTQDVDGATLNSRLSSLAPISFLNPADGQTRRRLFSLESMDPNNFVWANDNPLAFNLPAYLALQNYATNGGTFPGPATTPLNPYNSRFGPFGNASFATVNQVPDTSAYSQFANVNSVEVIPNPLLDAPIIAITQAEIMAYPGMAQNLTSSPVVNDVTVNPNPDYPTVYQNNYVPYNGLNLVNPALMTPTNSYANVSAPSYANGSSPYYPNLINGLSSNGNLNTASYPIPTPALAHRDRRINLNMPLPIANDPAEPVRQKWCRETYQLMKAILPPQAVDTPQELAALSQYVVNIIDFRDPDSTMTRFVNTDLMVVQPTATTPMGVQFAEIPVPQITVNPLWDPSGNAHTFYPFDPMIAAEQSNPTTGWIGAMTDTALTNPRARPLYLVQYGMEYNPIAINEVLAYSWYTTATTSTSTTQSSNIFTPRFYVELVNTLNDDSSHGAIASGTPTPGSGDMNLAGWDFLVMPDTSNFGRPDPITGAVPATAGLIANSAFAVTGDPGAQAPLSAGIPTTQPTTASANWTAVNTNVTPLPATPYPLNSFGWSLSIANGFYNSAASPPTVSYIPALRGAGTLTTPTPRTGTGTAAGTNAAGFNQIIGDSFFVLGSSTTLGTDRSPSVLGTPSMAIPDTFFPVGLGTPTYPPVTTPATAVYPGNQYFWLYLRRPANPFNPGQEMVVVDSFRFPYIVNWTQGQSKPKTVGPPEAGPWTDQWLAGENPANFTNTSTYNELFSVQRLQPFRGGHHVSPTPPSGPFGNQLATNLGRAQGHSYGYTEQTTPTTGTITGSTPAATPAIYGPNNALTANGNSYGTTKYNPAGYVFDTMGYANSPSDTGGWDYFPFHDRDFNSPAELLLVPGCPPGLFTKEFAEQTFNITTAPKAQTNSFTSTYAASTTAFTRANGVQSDAAITAPHPFPYLNDEFYYTAVSVSPSTDTYDPASSAQYPTQLGGWTGTGWYKMLDFFEVPNSAIGSTGTADAGENFDWFRNDRRPGLLNLNLIIDEEVFFGLLDDQRINTALAQYGYYLNNYAYQNIVGAYPVTTPFLPNLATLPQIISQVDAFGNPTDPVFAGNTGNKGYYNISDPNTAGGAVTSLAPGYVDAFGNFLNTQLRTNAVAPNNYLPIYPATATNATNANTSYVGRGFSYPDPAYSSAGLGQPYTASAYSQNLITGMKSAFADFLKLRSGGTNFMFGHQAPYTPPGTLSLALSNIYTGNGLNGNGSLFSFSLPPTQPPPNNLNVVWPDMPYRSLSYPDINYTIMRPALAVPPITQSSYSIAFAAANQVSGTSPLTFPPPYFYDLPTGSGPTASPIQSATLTALLANNANVPTPVILPTTQNSYVGDPGVRYPFMDLTFTNMTNINSGYNVRLNSPQIPPIPPRRLFAPPDSAGNASTKGDTNFTATNVSFTGVAGATPLSNLYLADAFGQLISTNNNPISGDPWTNFTPNPPNTTAYNPSQLFTSNVLPGGQFVQQNFISTGRRQTPYYRTEMLQKVMNLTTVRTHQFAVWITVGFFEVIHVGTPELGLPDVLGAEIDAAAGKPVRYRSFFTIDRTKASGFNPYYPGEFRNCVTYRRRIE